MVKSLYADPGTMNVSAAEAAKDLAPILKKNESDLAKAMSRKTRFVWLERLMDPEDSDKVQALIKEKGGKASASSMKAADSIPMALWQRMCWAL